MIAWFEAEQFNDNLVIVDKDYKLFINPKVIDIYGRFYVIEDWRKKERE